MSKLDAEEFCTLVRLFGDRVRIAPDGSVSIEHLLHPEQSGDRTDRTCLRSREPK